MKRGKYGCLFYMGRPWLTDWFGGMRINAPIRVIAWLPEAIRILQQVRN